MVSERAGLQGVINAWQNYSKYPAKPTTKDGMREIIRRERLNELACEGKRFWDLRRWKITLPKEIYGRKTVVYERPEYYYRDYLWPLKISTLLQNPNLIQNPGW